MLAAALVVVTGSDSRIGTENYMLVFYANSQHKNRAPKRKGKKKSPTFCCSIDKSSMHSIKNSTFLSINGLVDNCSLSKSHYRTKKDGVNNY